MVVKIELETMVYNLTRNLSLLLLVLLTTSINCESVVGNLGNNVDNRDNSDVAKDHDKTLRSAATDYLNRKYDDKYEYVIERVVAVTEKVIKKKKTNNKLTFN